MFCKYCKFKYNAYARHAYVYAVVYVRTYAYTLTLTYAFMMFVYMYNAVTAILRYRLPPLAPAAPPPRPRPVAPSGLIATVDPTALAYRLDAST